jgi:hypothetical protein
MNYDMIRYAWACACTDAMNDGRLLCSLYDQAVFIGWKKAE